MPTAATVPAPAPSTSAERLAQALSTLNEAQRAAVEHGWAPGGAGAADARPLLVIAGAGSGKTSTLAHRVAGLIARGTDPRRILLLTDRKSVV